MERWRSGRAIGIHISNQIAERRQLQSLDQSAALSNGSRELQGANGGVSVGHAPDHPDGVIDTTIEYDHELKIPGIPFFEILGVIPKHRLDAVFFVIRWNQQ